MVIVVVGQALPSAPVGKMQSWLVIYEPVEVTCIQMKLEMNSLRRIGEGKSRRWICDSDYTITQKMLPLNSL
jgi:hypothetical protein